ncbi:hypothetical protein EVAR_100350_1 [Eumeta japonica]|uniref:Uncharacterized protein n=1 Tax=Eumeta variegata TaxID=151549 RepID=A0A4C2AFR2_EUMVA|nr:hypothetical protein EVAR_100350_1 [Eumeta japonica]
MMHYRDYSEDEFRRDEKGGQQWRSEMQDYDSAGREIERQNSKDSYKDYGDYKDPISDDEIKISVLQNPIISQPPRLTTPPHNLTTNVGSQAQNLKLQANQTGSGQGFIHNQQIPSNMMQSQPINVSQNQTSFPDMSSKPINQNFNKLDQNLSSSNLSLSQFSSEPISHTTSNKPCFITQKSEKELSESESIASKSSTDPSTVSVNKFIEAQHTESLRNEYDTQRPSMSTDEKLTDRFINDNLNKAQNKEPVERKSSGSGSEKKGRGYGYGVGVRVWGSRESRGRRSHRSSRSKNRASESDGSTDGAQIQNVKNVAEHQVLEVQKDKS